MSSLKNKKYIKYLVLPILSAVLFSGMMSRPVMDSPEVRDALEKGYSQAIPFGMVLLKKDVAIPARDFTVDIPEEGKLHLYIWDFATEDGDYVRIFIDNEPISSSFMLKHEPRSFVISGECTVTVKGIRDGGDGITYAIRYGLNGATYFNNAPFNKVNTYTLVRSSK